MNWRFWTWGQPKTPAAAQDHEELKSFGDQLKSLAQNLITLEINTIIKENMIAGPMPTVHNALIEIASGYIKTFERLGVDISPLYPPYPDPRPLRPGEAGPTVDPNAPPPPGRADWETLDLEWGAPGRTPKYFNVPFDEQFRFVDLFISLQRAARLAGRHYKGQQPLSQDAVTVRRMEDNADKLRVILEDNSLGTETVSRRQIRSLDDVVRPNPELSISDRLTIKKIWEVGSERVIAQTVVQLDGDVVTRLASDFGTVQDVDKLLDLHQKGLATGINRWDSLMRAAVSVITGLTQSIRPAALNAPADSGSTSS